MSAYRNTIASLSHAASSVSIVSSDDFAELLEQAVFEEEDWGPCPVAPVTEFVTADGARVIAFQAGSHDPFATPADYFVVKRLAGDGGPLF